MLLGCKTTTKKLVMVLVAWSSNRGTLYIPHEPALSQLGSKSDMTVGAGDSHNSYNYLYEIVVGVVGVASYLYQIVAGVDMVSMLQTQYLLMTYISLVWYKQVSMYPN